MKRAIQKRPLSECETFSDVGHQVVPKPSSAREKAKPVETKLRITRQPTPKLDALRDAERALRIAKTAALYLRVSDDRQTLENQRPELEALARVRGLEVVRVYEETMSAAKPRAVFDLMMADAHRGTFDVLIVWALDRFGRSMHGNLDAVLKLDRRGVRVVSARESWLEMDGPARSLLVGVFSWVAEQERRRLSERTIAGMERARSQGRHVGRPRAPVTLSIARELRAQGVKLPELARQLGVSESSVRRALREAP